MVSQPAECPLRVYLKITQPWIGHNLGANSSTWNFQTKIFLELKARIDSIWIHLLSIYWNNIG